MEVMGNQGNLIWTKFQKIQPMHKMSITEVHKLIMKKNVIDSVGLLKNVVANYAKSSFIMSWILLQMLVEETEVMEAMEVMELQLEASNSFQQAMPVSWLLIPE